MIIICHTEPGYSNQLFQHVFAWAYAKENKRLFFNASGVSWWKYYRGGRPILLLLFSLLSSYRYKIPLAVQRIFKMGFVSLDSYETMNDKFQQLANYNLVFLSGWFLRVPLEKHRERLKAKFALRKKYYSKNRLVNHVKTLKEEGFILVGVHIRRGDYRNYEDGKYYYDFTVYMDKVRELRSLLSTDKVKFVLFSNESIPDHLKTQDILISQEEWFIDHYLMSNCDYLLGPPSTFTIWASFMGGAKLCLLHDPNRPIIFTDFQEYINPLCY